MRYGINLPQFEYFGDARRLVALAQRAESVGWDGVFLWDHILRPNPGFPVLDPWVVLGAIATATERVRLGTLITPLARRRPWKVAREAVTLDHLSGGRVILGVGLGSNPALEFETFGDPGDARLRAQRLDEALAILDGLWSGEPFRHDGTHYHLDEVTFRPRPVQRPRVPLWVAGRWPNKPPFRRAARWDGVCPEGLGGSELSTDDWRDILAYIADHRTSDAPCEAVHVGHSPLDKAEAAAKAARYAAVGVTWWVENVNPRWYGLPDTSARWPDEVAQGMVRRLEAGPPRP